MKIREHYAVAVQNILQENNSTAELIGLWSIPIYTEIWIDKLFKSKSNHTASFGWRKQLN